MYKVLMTRRAEKDLKALERSEKNRVIPAITALAETPRPSGCLKVKSEPGVWRIRVGDLRIGYSIDDAELEVTVLRIVHRREFYD